jgi:hypothetical protein
MKTEILSEKCNVKPYCRLLYQTVQTEENKINIVFESAMCTSIVFISDYFWAKIYESTSTFLWVCTMVLKHINCAEHICNFVERTEVGRTSLPSGFDAL